MYPKRFNNLGLGLRIHETPWIYLPQRCRVSHFGCLLNMEEIKRKFAQIINIISRSSHLCACQQMTKIKERSLSFFNASGDTYTGKAQAYSLLTKLNLESHLYLRQKGATWEESLTTWSVEQEREPADKRAEGGRGGQQQHHHHEVSPSK